MSYDPLPWDSEFFQIPIGRVRYEANCARTLSKAVEAADSDRTRCLYLLCPAEDVHTLHAALDLGFRPYDVRIELGRSLTDSRPEPAAAREANVADEPALARLARERFKDTRFFADSHFPRTRCRDLYVAWLRRGLSTAPLRRTFTVADAQGFIVCRFDARSGTGTIELVAVAQPANRREVSTVLVRAAENEFVAAGLANAQVATQGRNAPAQRLYQRQGYVTTSVNIWLHRWRHG